MTARFEARHEGLVGMDSLWMLACGQACGQRQKRALPTLIHNLPTPTRDDRDRRHGKPADALRLPGPILRNPQPVADGQHKRKRLWRTSN